MKYQVIYFSRNGSIKKVADVIVSEIGIKSEDVKDAKLDADSMVFIGSGCYGSKPAKIITEFIEDNEFKSKNIALFGTSGGGKGMEVKDMEKTLNSKQANIKGKFFCKGRLFLMNRGRPNDEDLDNTRKFAKHVIK